MQAMHIDAASAAVEWFQAALAARRHLFVVGKGGIHNHCLPGKEFHGVTGSAVIVLQLQAE
jgi:hypothetical protein